MADKKHPTKSAKPAAAKVAAAMPTAAAPAPKPADAAKAVAAPKQAEAPKPAAPAAKQSEPPKAAPVAKAADAKPVEAAAKAVVADSKPAAPAPVKAEAPKPAPAAKAEAPKPAPAAKAEAPKPAPVKADAPKPVKADAPKPVEAVQAAPARPAAPAIVAAAVMIETKTVNATQNEGTKTMNTETTQVVTDRFQAAFGDINERSRAAMERSTKIVEELTELTKGNIEAVVASSKVAARGVESMSQEAADFGRRSFEEASNAFKSFAEVKSPTEFFKLQSDYARSAFDGMVAETSKMSEAMLKLAGEVAEPLSSRYAIAAERVKNVAA